MQIIVNYFISIVNGKQITVIYRNSIVNGKAFPQKGFHDQTHRIGPVRWVIVDWLSQSQSQLRSSGLWQRVSVWIVAPRPANIYNGRMVSGRGQCPPQNQKDDSSIHGLMKIGSNSPCTMRQDGTQMIVI